VLFLVLAHRDLVGPVRQHVGGLEDRVREQARRDEVLLLGGLLLELVHPGEVAVGRGIGQQPTELGVFPDVGLPEQDAAVGVQPGGQEDRRGVVEPFPEVRRVIGHGYRVEVNDAVDGLAPVLPLDVLADGPDVVPQVLPPRRLDAGEDPHGPHRVPGR
jgi:hypothetical protein